MLSERTCNEAVKMNLQTREPRAKRIVEVTDISFRFFGDIQTYSDFLQSLDSSWLGGLTNSKTNV